MPNKLRRGWSMPSLISEPPTPSSPPPQPPPAPSPPPPSQADSAGDSKPTNHGGARPASPMSISRSDSPMSVSSPDSPPLEVVCDYDFDSTNIDGIEISSFYQIREESHRVFKNGPLEEQTFKIELTKDIPGETALERTTNLQRVFDDAFQSVISMQEINCTGQFVIASNEFIKETTSTPLQRLQDITFEDVAQSIGRILNSSETISLDKMSISLLTYSLDFKIGGLSTVYRTSLNNRTTADMKAYIKKKSCFYNPLYFAKSRSDMKTQGMCLPLCLTREITLVEMKRKYGTVTKHVMLNYGKSRECREKAENLVTKAGLFPTYGPFKLGDIASLARFLPDACALNVFVDTKEPLLKFNHNNSTDVIHLFLLFDKDVDKETSLESGQFHTYSICDKYKDSKIIFHNFGKYDGQLFVKELARLKCPPKHIIRRGQQIILLELAQNGISSRDSLLFLPGIPLSKFNKLFKTTEAKGDFPFLLNKPKWVNFNDPERVYIEHENTGVIHRFPKLEYFMVESRSSEGVEKLKQWHQEQVEKFNQDSTLVYQPVKEIIRYCQLDTKILRQGMTKFRQTFREQFPEMKVFDSLTFSSLNNAVFRKYFMPPNSLALVSPTGYPTKNRKFSVIGLAWVAWMENELGLVAVRDARRGGEVYVAGTHFDGVGLDAQGQRHVLEFHGCLYHGHECIQPRTENLEILAQDSETRDQRLKSLSNDPNSPYGLFKLHIIYECELKATRQKNPALDQYIRDFTRQYFECKEPLRIRDGLRGGRTNAILHNIPTIPEGYTLAYYDFTSLYPSVQYWNEYPIGFPDIFYGKLLEKAPKPGQWFGFVKATVLPNQSLLHPVLGHLVGSKLLFASCAFCAQHANDKYPPTNVLQCTHSDLEWAFTSVYFTGELDLALSHGYKILKIYEIYHWPEEKRSTELFKDLIRSQYKNKAKSSPAPKNTAELERLITEYHETMDLVLTPEDFEENPTLRTFSKLSLNNIWGFLGKRTAQENTDFIVHYSDFLKLTCDASKEIIRIALSEGGDAIFVTWKPLEEKASITGSVAIAALVTSYARIKLYRLIDRYQKHVVYFDTDSLVVLLPPDLPKPETSTVLGGLKDEILESYGSDAYITSFCSLGPKSYSYTVKNSQGKVLDCITKMKGIRFNAETERILCEGSMTELVNSPAKTYQVPQYLIGRDMFKSSLYSKKMWKRVSFNSRKRQLLNDKYLSSIPFGYKEAHSESMI